MLTKELTSKTTSFAKGANYVGETWYGKKHGEGTMTWANGSKYAGQWNNGKKHGAVNAVLLLNHGDATEGGQPYAVRVLVK